MSFNADTLFRLLPSIYRIRDAEQGGPLKALLEVIAGQTAVLEEDLAQLYDDQFIETCADWVVPYIGDLVGYRSPHPDAPSAVSLRAEVANTLAYRRRKGTAAMLEQLARDATGFDARVVEFFQRLATTQFMNHVRPANLYAPDLRRWETREWMSTPFDTTARTVDVRRIATGRGQFNLPNVGIFLWRLHAHRTTRAAALDLGDGRFCFSQLGQDLQLFNPPLPETNIVHLAEPRNVPAPLRRRPLLEEVEAWRQALVDGRQPQPVYFGKDPVFELFLDGSATAVSPREILICDLAAWPVPPAAKTYRHISPEGETEDVPCPITVAVDPESGRLMFPPGVTPSKVEVSYAYGFGADLGGGEYERAATFEQGLELAGRVSATQDVQGALTAATEGGVVEITDNARCEQALVLRVNAGRRLELRAANERRPLLTLPGNMDVRGNEGTEVILNGLLISGAALRVPADEDNKLARLCLRHCTLVPGLGLTTGGDPQQPDQPSLIVEQEGVTVELDHCIVGGLRVAKTATVRIADSIVDATQPTGVAFAAPGAMPAAGGPLRVEESTIIGKVHTVFLELASNSIFAADLADSGETWNTPIRSEQKQAGCVRFCALPWEARTPRRYRCQPDLEIARRIEEAEQRAQARHKTLSKAEREAICSGVRAWLRPALSSTRYGDAAYGQLSLRCSALIRSGADDESEMGAFHTVFLPQREANLRLRLQEYLRFGLEAGIFYVT